MSSKAKSPLRWTLLGIVVGCAFLWLALRNVDIDDAWYALKTLRMQWVFPIIGCGMLFILVKSYRWYFLLRPALMSNQSFTSGQFGILHRAVYAGTAANLVVAHTGEVLRATLIARRSGIPASAVLAGIGLERVLDFSALLILIGLAFLIDPNVSTILWSAAIVSLTLIFCGLAVLTALLSPSESRTAKTVNRLLRILPDRLSGWIVVELEKSKVGLGAISEPTTLLKVLALSLAQWFFIVLSIWACAAAIGVQISLSGAITVFVLTVIGLTLPASPAQLGTVQLAFVAGLTAMNLPATSALAASLLYTGLVNGTMMLIGAVCWFRWPQIKTTEPERGTATEGI